MKAILSCGLVFRKLAVDIVTIVLMTVSDCVAGWH